jgi:hypothetical protein
MKTQQEICAGHPYFRAFAAHLLTRAAMVSGQI